MAWVDQRRPERFRWPFSLSQLRMAAAPRRSSTYSNDSIPVAIRCADNLARRPCHRSQTRLRTFDRLLGAWGDVVDPHRVPSSHSSAVAKRGGERMNQQAPAGWYPDPEKPGSQRYWTGTAWSASPPPNMPVPRTMPPAQWGQQPGFYPPQRHQVVVKEKRGCLSSAFRAIWLIIGLFILLIIVIVVVAASTANQARSGVQEPSGRSGRDSGVMHGRSVRTWAGGWNDCQSLLGQVRLHVHCSVHQERRSRRAGCRAGERHPPSANSRLDRPR